MSEPVDWGRETEESEAAYTKHLEGVMDRPKQVKEEKRAASEIAVKKGMPYGITRKIGQYIGKSQGGKKHKTRRGGKKKSRRTKHRK